MQLPSPRGLTNYIRGESAQWLVSYFIFHGEDSQLGEQNANQMKIRNV